MYYQYTCDSYRLKEKKEEGLVDLDLYKFQTKKSLKRALWIELLKVTFHNIFYEKTTEFNSAVDSQEDLYDIRSKLEAEEIAKNLLDIVENELL